MIFHLSYVYFDWQAIQATHRLEDEVKEQSRSLELERNKRVDAMRTFKNSEANLSKAREDRKSVV